MDERRKIYIEGKSPNVLRYNTEEEYSYIDLVECDDPFCGCLSGVLVFLSKKEFYNDFSLGVPISFSIDSKKLFIEDHHISEEDVPTAKIILADLQEFFLDEDWALLKRIFIEKKRAAIQGYKGEDYIERLNLTEEQLFNEDLLLEYPAIFPHAEVLTIEYEGVHYKVLDQYCKRLKCECNTVSLQVFKDSDYCFDVDYNYKKQKVSNENYSWLGDQLISQYPEIKYLLQLREYQIKVLHANLKNEIQKLHLQSLIEKKEFKKVGRNDLCPCGSGKKYKKCCLNK